MTCVGMSFKPIMIECLPAKSYSLVWAIAYKWQLSTKFRAGAGMTWWVSTKILTGDPGYSGSSAALTGMTWLSTGAVCKLG